MMEEYTPANSVYFDDDDDMVERIDASRTRRWLRVANGVLHLGVCVVLLAIIATFLARSGGVFYRRMT